MIGENHLALPIGGALLHLPSREGPGVGCLILTIFNNYPVIDRCAITAGAKKWHFGAGGCRLGRDLIPSS